MPAAGIETVVTDCYETKVKENLQLYLVPTGEGEYLNMAFSNTGEEFTYIRSAPDENSDWIGKLYPDSAVRVLEYKEDWVKIQSGDAQDSFRQIHCTWEKMQSHMQGNTKKRLQR